jgi:transcriptional regulator with XRE-family HTH domain
MPRTPSALIDPSLLKWARSAAGMTTEEAAKRLSVRPERLMAWEKGKEPLTIAQLRAAARVYKRPLAVFYLPEPPRDFQPLRDFRRLPETEEERLSPQLQAAIRRAHSLREAALELRDMAGEPPTEAPRIDPAPRDPEAFAVLARERLGVSLATQLEWADPGRALSGWTAALEDLDVMVLQP